MRLLAAAVVAALAPGVAVAAGPIPNAQRSVLVGTAIGDISLGAYCLDIGLAGVKFCGDGDGAITLLGMGNGSDEDLTLNLDDTSNVAVWSSSTGVASWTLPFNLTSVGTIGSGAVTSTGNVFAGAAASLGFTGRSIITSGADGAISLRNNANSTYSSLAVGDIAAGAIYGLTPVEAVVDGVGSPNVLTTAECGKTVTNEGATSKAYNTLPTATTGCWFKFVVQDADDLRVTANTGDTIRLNASVSISAGYAEAVEIGAVLVLEAINATEWIGTFIVGSWAVETS